MTGVVRRMVSEYAGLSRVLAPPDLLALGAATIANAPGILRSRKLASLDAAMRRNMRIRFDGMTIALPIQDMDRLLEGKDDSSTFANLREIYAHNCYLQGLKFPSPVRVVLDAGAHCGMFSVLALAHLGSETVVGVDPEASYDSALKLLLHANGFAAEKAPRYRRSLTCPVKEKNDPENNVSVQTILREKKIDRIHLIKMNIEGAEKDVFSEPDWLEAVDTISMEIHPQFVDDLSCIPKALTKYGFEFRLMDQERRPAEIRQAMYLQASRVGALA